MHDALIVEVPYSFKEIHHYPLSLLLVRKAELLQVAVEGEGIELEDDIGWVLSLVNAVYLAEVFVVDFSQNFELFAEGDLHRKEVTFPLPLSC